MPNNIKTVLLDLDGTLLDTAPDLATALNQVLQNNHRDPIPYDRVRQVVSHGGRALIQLGFDLNPDNPEFEALRLQLLEYYQNNICEQTRLFPGMEQVLNVLEERSIPWGIVTNKPGWLTNPLLHKLKLLEKAGCIICGDTLPQCKPDPAPLLHAATLIGTTPAQCLYVGDAERDIEAGRNAGMTTLAALFGYLLEDDRPETWGADALIEHPEQILDWLSDSALN